LLQKRSTIHTGHPHVGYNDIERLTRKHGQSLYSAFRERRAPLLSQRPQRALQTLKHARFIIDK